MSGFVDGRINSYFAAVCQNLLAVSYYNLLSVCIYLFYVSVCLFVALLQSLSLSLPHLTFVLASFAWLFRMSAK